MANIHTKPSWHLPERAATPEHVYRNRREFLRLAGGATIAAAGLFSGLEAQGASMTDVEQQLSRLRNLGVKRNPNFRVPQAITDERIAAVYNNFYEFSTAKDGVWRLSQDMKTSPWQVEVTGLVAKPKTFAVEDLLKRMPIEERVYRLRCVEAWSMVIPWVGFPMSALLKEVEPLSSAKFVMMSTFMNPEVAPRQRPSASFFSREPWPYHEGLTLPEAMNDLTLLTVGSYGHVLPPQHGAPIRLITPWKYGFKSIKSIVKIELTDTQPATFWNMLAPNEYGFQSNVNPRVPHPRWSQAMERVIGTRRRQPTLLYNGYAEQVGHLYQKA